jgi:predicted nucleic acid-binding protein
LVGWLLDTNLVSELGRTRRDSNVTVWVTKQSEGDLYISVLTLGEFDKGLHNLPVGSPARHHIEVGIREIEIRFGGRTLPVSDAIVRRWGRISGDILFATGRAPEVIDTLLAATAIEHGLVLATRNVRHVQDTGARVFNPWQDDPGSPLTA